MNSKDDQRKAAQAKREQQTQIRAKQARRARQIQILAGIVVVAIVVVGAIALINSNSNSKNKDGGKAGLVGIQETRDLLSGLTQQGEMLGNPSAKYTLIEFSDLQCPFCAKYTVDVLPTVIDKFVRNGQMKLQHNLLTFVGQESLMAAQIAAAAAAQNKSWDFTYLFYLNQGTENSGYITNGFLRKIASAIPNLDVKKVFSQQKSKQVEALISKSQATANQLGVNSTPTFYMSKAGKKPQKLEINDLTPDEFTQQINTFIKNNK